MPTSEHLKRTHADDVAQALADGSDVALCVADVAKMSDADLFDWLETLGYEWTGTHWVMIGVEP
jgi:hypothetical protein